MTNDFSRDELARLIEVFSGDSELLSWFTSLETMAESARSSHLHQMAEGMKIASERPELVALINSLRSPEMFRAAVQSARDLNGISS